MTMLPEMVQSFHSYLHERERIRIRRELDGKIDTEDAILKEYKFTNVLREHDRTTRWVNRNWYAPNHNQPLDIQALNCAIFRYFGTAEFAEELGYQYEWNPEYIISTAKARMSRKQKVFTGAYIITNGGISAPKEEVVVGNYLQPFREKLGEIVRVAEETRSWRQTGTVLRTIPGMGAFMTKEVLLDMMLTKVLQDATDKLTWTPVGPGAIRGLNRIHGRPVNAPLSQEKGLREIQDLLAEFAALGFAPWMPKIGVKYGVTDVQFGLCEFDKYQRVLNNEGRPRSKFRPSKEPLPEAI